MALGVDRAVAEIIRDGDPARAIPGLATLDGWDLYDASLAADRRIHVGEAPDDPDSIVVVVLEGGLPPIGAGDPNSVQRQPSFSIRSRDLSYETALERAQEVHTILDMFQGKKREVPFFRILAQGEPFPLGRDREQAGGRWITTQTFSSFTKRYALS